MNTLEVVKVMNRMIDSLRVAKIHIEVERIKN